MTPTPHLVALDVDGTTINHAGEMSPVVRDAVRAVVAAGHHVTIATGRSIIATMPILRELGIETGYAVCSNGAVTLRLDPAIEVGYEITEAVTFDAAPALNLLRDEWPEAVVAVEELGVGFKVSAPFPDGELQGNITVVPWDELLAHPVTRVTFRDPTGTAEDFMDLAERIGLHGVNYAVGFTAWLDVNPEGVSKGSALELVRRELGIEPAYTVAVGDQRNDLEMLHWAARGVAMGNAPDEVKAIADETTLDVDDDGLVPGAPITPVSNAAQNTARDIGNHPIVEKGARLGFAVSGLIHLLIAWIAIQVAWGGGDGSDSADKSGALEIVAGGSPGPALLWLTVVGFVLLAIWQASEAIVGRHSDETSHRLKSGAKSAMYAFFAYSAYALTKGASSSDEKKTDEATAGLMSSPGGRILVGLLALAILVTAAYHMWKGWTKSFLEELREHPATWAVNLGRAGYVAKGIAFAVVGLLFGSAALSGRAAEAGGLDAALKELRDQSFGPYLLTIVALGLAAAGAYSFVKARLAKL